MKKRDLRHIGIYQDNKGRTILYSAKKKEGYIIPDNDIIDAKIKSLYKNKEEENYNKRINKILERNTLVNIHYPTIGSFLRKDLRVIQTVHTLSSDEGLFTSNKKRKLYTYLRKLVRGTYNRWLEKKSFKKALHIITLNEDLKEKIIKYGISEEKISIISNGVDTKYFKFKELQSISNDEPIKLLYAGRLAVRKNVLMILKSLKFFSNLDFTLDIVGKGEQENKLKRFVEKNDMGDMVKFLGYKSGIDLLNSYSNSDVYVLPSFYEGLPFTVLEAMAVGRACVIGNFSNADKLVVNNSNGFVVPVNGVESFVSVFKEVIKNKEKLKEFGENSHKKIIQEYSIEKTFEKVLNLFNKYTKW